MPADTRTLLKQEGWSLSDKGIEQLLEDAGASEFDKVKAFLLDVCI